MGKAKKQVIPEFYIGKPFQDISFNKSLWSYMKNLWEDPADYKVLMANRMFNLNVALMKEWNIKENDQYSLEGIMSDNAFLLSVDTVVNRYIRKKCFPRILICNDILVYGKEIIDLIQKFYILIKEYLNEKEVEFNEKDLKSDLRKAIIIYVFACDSKDYMIIDKKNYKLFTIKVVSTKILRELSLELSNYLLSSENLNTNYVLSIKLNWYQMKKLFSKNNSDLESAFLYNGCFQKVFYRERIFKIFETINITYFDNKQWTGGFLTSFPIISELSYDSFDLICRVLAINMEKKTKYSQIAKYLRWEKNELIIQRAQLLVFLYSVLSIVDFCRQFLDINGVELYRILVSGDYDKIISNFDKNDVFRYEILQFFRDVSQESTDNKDLWDIFKYIIHQGNNFQERIFDVEKFNFISNSDKEIIGKVYRDAEDIFYEIAIDEEYNNYRCFKKNLSYEENNSRFNIISFNKYLYYMEGGSKKEQIACLFGLMNSGLVSINMEYFCNGDKKRVQTVLKAEDLSLYVLPKRFFVFISALATVEYRQHEKNFCDVIEKFIEFVYNYPKKELKDKYLLDNLYEKKSLLLYLYSVGQTFRDWNIDLRVDRKYFGKRNFLTDTEMLYEDEFVQKRKYLFLAKEFCS